MTEASQFFTGTTGPACATTRQHEMQLQNAAVSSCREEITCAVVCKCTQAVLHLFIQLQLRLHRVICISFSYGLWFSGLEINALRGKRSQLMHATPLEPQCRDLEAALGQLAWEGRGWNP